MTKSIRFRPVEVIRLSADRCFFSVDIKSKRELNKLLKTHVNLSAIHQQIKRHPEQLKLVIEKTGNAIKFYTIIFYNRKMYDFVLDAIRSKIK